MKIMLHCEEFIFREKKTARDEYKIYKIKYKHKKEKNYCDFNRTIFTKEAKCGCFVNSVK